MIHVKKTKSHAADKCLVRYVLQSCVKVFSKLSVCRSASPRYAVAKKILAMSRNNLVVHMRFMDMAINKLPLIENWEGAQSHA